MDGSCPTFLWSAVNGKTYVFTAYVTALVANGFYMQDSDNNWSGLFVYLRGPRELKSISSGGYMPDASDIQITITCTVVVFRFRRAPVSCLATTQMSI